MSGALKKANEETSKRSRVYMDHKQVCNLGQVRYLMDASGIHRLSNGFYSRVKRLPLKYSVGEYMDFIRDRGTVSDKAVRIKYSCGEVLALAYEPILDHRNFTLTNSGHNWQQSIVKLLQFGGD